MLESFETFAATLGLDPRTLVLIIIGIGAALTLVGVMSAATQVDPATSRLNKTRDARIEQRRNKGVLMDRVVTSKGILRTFVPKNPGQLTKLKITLIQAGYRRDSAVQTYTSIRVLSALTLPAIFVALLGMSSLPGFVLPFGMADFFGGLSQLQIFQILAVLTFLGYIIPAQHIESRAKETRLRIMESFPNALDLLQVSVEAGLGLDAAMTRVGNELATVCPQLSAEFLTAQRQIQAGRPRDVAMREMAERCGVDTVSAFVKVLQQSIQFGTPISEALATYAAEMRLYRDLAAQEMANKLPVKMSVVLASLMLPALVLMTVGPTVLRWIAMSGPATGG